MSTVYSYSPSAIHPLNYDTLSSTLCNVEHGYPRPFSKGDGQRMFLVVAFDYFTQWVEAEAVASIIEREVRKFIWKNIITRFGVPRAMVFDNGRQFHTDKLRDYCAGCGMQTQFIAVARG